MSSLENFRLVVFRAVARSLSFRKAAEELLLSQPAVSLQIKALEEELGLPLFDRHGSYISLTPAGHLLVETAERSHQLAQQTLNQLAALSGTHAGELILGASTTIAQYVLPRLLGQFCRLHPAVRPRLVSGNTEQIVDALEHQQIALGLIEGPARSAAVRTDPFLRDELVLIAPISLAETQRGRIDLDALTRLPLLMRERGSGSRRVLELALEAAGLRLNALQIAMELDSTEAIKSATDAGLGCGFVSRWALASDTRLDRSFRIVEVRSLRVPRDLSIAAPNSPELAGLPLAFRRFLNDRAQELRPGTR